jgi:hypothetical protein
MTSGVTRFWRRVPCSDSSSNQVYFLQRSSMLRGSPARRSRTTNTVSPDECCASVCLLLKPASFQRILIGFYLKPCSVVVKTTHFVPRYLSNSASAQSLDNKALFLLLVPHYVLLLWAIKRQVLSHFALGQSPSFPDFSSPADS